MGARFMGIRIVVFYPVSRPPQRTSTNAPAKANACGYPAPFTDTPRVCYRNAGNYLAHERATIYDLHFTDFEIKEIKARVDREGQLCIELLSECLP